MAVVAIIAAGNVRWMFSGCRLTIVTGEASAQHLRMIHCHHGLPNVGRVTIFAHVGRLDMGRVLAGGVCAVVTTCAVAREVHMIEIGR